MWRETQHPRGVLPAKPAVPKSRTTVLRDRNTIADVPKRKSRFSVFGRASKAVSPPPAKKKKAAARQVDLARAHKPIWTVTLKRKRKQDFGFEVSAGGDQGITIREVTRETPAHKAGLRIGDVILTLDGFRCQDLPLDEALELIQHTMATKKEMRIMIRPGAEPTYTGGSLGSNGSQESAASHASSTRSGPHYAPDTFMPPPMRVGSMFSLHETSTDPSPPKPVRPDNGASVVYRAPHPHRRRSSGAILDQQQQQQQQQQQRVAHERKISMHVTNPNALMGLHIRGNRTMGIIITAIDPGSLAESVGLLPGDRILDVNGQSFIGIDHAQAVRVLNSNTHMMLTVVNDMATEPNATFPRPAPRVAPRAGRRVSIVEPDPAPPGASVTSPKRTFHTMLRENHQAARGIRLHHASADACCDDDDEALDDLDDEGNMRVLKRRRTTGHGLVSRPMSVCPSAANGMLGALNSVAGLPDSSLASPAARHSMDDSLLDTSTSMFQEAPTPGTELGHYLQSMHLQSDAPAARPAKESPIYESCGSDKGPTPPPRPSLRRGVKRTADKANLDTEKPVPVPRKASRTLARSSPSQSNLPAAAPPPPPPMPPMAGAAAPKPSTHASAAPLMSAAAPPPPPPPPPPPAPTLHTAKGAPAQPPAIARRPSQTPMMLSEIRNFDRTALRRNEPQPHGPNLRPKAAPARAMSTQDALIKALQSRFKKCNEEATGNLDASWRSEA